MEIYTVILLIYVYLRCASIYNQRNRLKAYVMKIVSILLLLVSFQRLYSVDISTNNAFTLFPTKIDTMSSLYEFPFKDSLNILTNDLIFFDLSSNPVLGGSVTNAFIDFDFGYYREGNIPISLLANIRYAPRNITESLPYQSHVPNETLTRVEYNNKPLGADPIGGSASFLTEINDAISTGIVLDFEYGNNNVSSSNVFFTNFITFDATETSYFNNDPRYTLDVNVPIYYTDDIYKHYFEVGAVLEFTGSSNGVIHKENDIITVEDITVNFRSFVSPYISYTFGYELEKDVTELRVSTRIALGIITDEDASAFKSSLSPLGTQKEEYDNTYNPSADFDFSAGVLVQSKTLFDWLTFRTFPTFGYSLDISPQQTESLIAEANYELTTDKNPFTSVENYYNELYLYVPMAFKIHEETWPVGFILASYFKFGYEYRYKNTVNNDSSLSNSGDRVVLDGVRDYSHNWDYDIKTQLGFFVPIKEYQIAGGINFDREFGFESFDVRFSMPLNLGIKKDKPPVVEDTPPVVEDKPPIVEETELFFDIEYLFEAK